MFNGPEKTLRLTRRWTMGRLLTVGKVTKRTVWRSAFMLFRHSKYSTILSIIHSYRLLFRRFCYYLINLVISLEADSIRWSFFQSMLFELYRVVQKK